jgi:hypothetical protein
MASFIDPQGLRVAELFFHVFAHVSDTAHLPASVSSQRYVAWCRALLGDASERTLAEDARHLAAEFRTHAALAAVQPLAKLYATIERLSQVGERSLADLEPADVDDPRALSHLQALGGGAELAFCALLLELPAFSRLPPPPPPPPRLLDRVASLVPVAPSLSEARIGCVRSLYLRGRAWGEELWLGHPGAEIAPSVEHAAWQAAHEATVVAVSRERPALVERAVEAEAMQRLTGSAAAIGEQLAHAAWQHSLSALD